MINVVFDLDDTLYSLLPVFEKTLQDFIPNHSLDVKDFYIAFREEANKLFPASQSGEISMETLHRKRAQNAFERVNMILSDDQADAFHHIYAHYKETIELSPEAIRAIQFMQDKGVKTGIITNGTSDKQRKTMKSLNISQYFHDDNLIIVSGELGIDKPNREIFDAWLHRAQNNYPTVYVGDSFNHDIIGAYQAGWIPIWVNSLNKTHPSVSFDFIEIKHLDALLSLKMIEDLNHSI